MSDISAELSDEHRQIAKLIMLEVQGHDFGREVPAQFGHKGTDFITTSTQIDLLEQVCNKAATRVLQSLRSGNGGEVATADQDYDDIDDPHKTGLAGLMETSTPPVWAETGEPPFEFDRYVNGQLMAEGVTVERQPTLEKAMQVAARIAAKGPNGETPVLIFASPQPPTPAGVREITGKDLLHAIIEMPHSINGSEITIRRDDRKAGNATSQLHAILDAALAAAKGGWGMSRKTKPLPSPLTEKFIAEREAREEAGE